MYKIDSSIDKPDIDYLVSEVTKMMQRGIKLGNLSKLYNTCLIYQNDIAETLISKYGIFNPNSSKQVIAYLESLNDQNVVEACAPNGKWTSNKAALEIVESLGYKLATLLINYRKFKKYSDSIKGMQDIADKKGYIHPEVYLTKTNRISYRSPAIMNIPKELLWNAVIPPRDGSVLFSADIKNQEPNILINMNNIETLKPALESENGLYEAIYESMPIYGRMNLIFADNEKPGLMNNELLRIRDINPRFFTPKLIPYSNVTINNEELQLIDIINFVVPIKGTTVYPTTISVKTKAGNTYSVPITFDVDLSKSAVKKKRNQGGIVEVDGVIHGLKMNCTGQVRKEFKRAWIAMTYGASKSSIIQMCKHIDGEVIYNYFTKIPELGEYRTKCHKMAVNKIQTTHTYFGTELVAGEYNTGALKRVLLDLPVQGTGADILSLLVKHFNSEVANREYNDNLRIYYTRHDELIIEATKELVDKLGIEKIKSEISDIVEHQIDNWVPFKVEVNPVEPNEDIMSLVETDDEDA